VAGDPFRHVQAGEPLRVSATAYNAMLDAALAHRQSQLTVGADRRSCSAPTRPWSS
jgi:hypothetical protein